MGPQPWHGLSHTRAWGHVGDSYSALAQTDKQDRGNLLPGDPSHKAERAGVLSSSKIKGAGTFQLQVHLLSTQFLQHVINLRRRSCGAE